MSLQEKINEIVSLKEAAGQYEIIDDTVNADILEHTSDAMLQQINDELLQRIAPEKFDRLPPRAKLLLQQLSRLYVRLYAEVNIGTEPSMYTAIMQRLKESVPMAITGGLMSGVLMRLFSGSNRNVIYVVLGWALAHILYNTGDTLVRGTDTAVTPRMGKLLSMIADTENQLTKYDIDFKSIKIGLPQINGRW